MRPMAPKKPFGSCSRASSTWSIPRRSGWWTVTRIARRMWRRRFSWTWPAWPRGLSSKVMLGGWLHRHTCFIAAKTLRGERRRQDRERQATEMNALEDHGTARFEQIASILDEAINQLSTPDRTAIVLR